MAILYGGLYIWFLFKSLAKKAIRCCVWMFDRYYYDYLIDPKRGKIKLPRWLLKLGQFFIPEPDMILCLGTNAESIHRRKPELTLIEVERQVVELKNSVILIKELFGLTQVKILKHQVMML